MAEINLVNITQKGTLEDTDHVAIWPSFVDETSDLQYFTLDDLLAYLEGTDTFLPKTIAINKGDLLVATASETVAALPVGTDKKVLVADSTKTAGVDWATVETDSIASRAVTSDKLKTLEVSTITGANITLDFTGSGHLIHTLTGDTTYSVNTSTYGPGRTLTIRITAASTRLLYFPSDWVFVGLKPTAILGGKTGVLSVTCFGTTAADCVAAWAAST